MPPKTRLAMVVLIASCASPHRGATTVEDRRPRRTAPDSSAQLSEAMVRFSTSVSQALNDDGRKPPVSNTYSHQRLLGPSRRLGEPQVQLRPTDAHSMLASTDCSGWLTFVLNTVSPLHAAVLRSQQRLDVHNRVYSDDFALREVRRPWPRAFVVAQYLRSDYVEATGFDPVTSFEDLQPGDIGAYAMGRYAKPSDENRPTPRDTGHVFVVVGAPTVVDPETEGYDGKGTLREDAAKVVAVPVVDSSATLHFDPDSRKNEEGRYALPSFRPHLRAKPGGVGSGVVWFALSSDGVVLQRRLGPNQRYRPVLARAARLRGRITLDDAVMDGGGALVVRVLGNAPSKFEGSPYGEAPVHLTGPGGLRVASGRLVLKGQNDFSGGVIVQSADLVAASPNALGVGDVFVRGGSLTLEKPALASGSTLSLAEGLPEGAIRLDFRGRDVVRTLKIGDAIHRCGTWGGPESGADFVDPVFSGQGVLQLSAKPEPCSPEPAVSRGRRAKKRTPS